MGKLSKGGAHRSHHSRPGHYAWVACLSAISELPGCGARDGVLGAGHPTQVSTALALPTLTGAAPSASQLELPVVNASATGSAPAAPSPVADQVFAARAENLLAVYGVNQRVWAVGVGGTLLSWEDSEAPLDPLAFDTHTLAKKPTLRAVWASARDDVWAVGDAGTIAHWDGATWTAWPSLNLGHAALNSIWGASADDIWAVGEKGWILHFDGAAWSPVAIDVTEDLRSVLGTSASDVLISGCSAALHYDGSTWQSQPSQSGVGNCWLEAFPGRAGEIWLTGYHYGGGEQWTLLESWVAGEPKESVKHHQPKVGWGLSDGRIVSVTASLCVGREPEQCSKITVYRAQEATADTTESPFLITPAPVNDLWGRGPSVWAVGDRGLVARITPP